MKVRVLYFGTMKEALGRPADELTLPQGSTVADLLELCRKASPVVQDYRDALAVAVNAEFARSTTQLKEGDEVALLPPVSGGAPAAMQSAHCLIQRGPLDTQGIVASIKHPEDGAVSVFDGIVRDHTRDRKTLYLVYEAYEDMAIRQMEKLVADAKERFAVRDVRIAHRLGRLEIGETSVLVVVAAAHRAVAMDACRFLIDMLKRTVPIWKKEYFENGAVWADGEPFPDDVRASVPSPAERPASK